MRFATTLKFRRHFVSVSLAAAAGLLASFCTSPAPAQQSRQFLGDRVQPEAEALVVHPPRKPGRIDVAEAKRGRHGRHHKGVSVNLIDGWFGPGKYHPGLYGGSPWYGPAYAPYAPYGPLGTFKVPPGSRVYQSGPVQSLIVEPGPFHVPQAVVAPTSFSDRAEQAMRNRQYEQAVRLTRHALIDEASSPRIHLLQSHALLAVGEYRDAQIALANAVTFTRGSSLAKIVAAMGELHPADDYRTQVARLQRRVGADQDNKHRLLLAYHLAAVGQQQAAQDHLRMVKVSNANQVLHAAIKQLAVGSRSGTGAEELPVPAGPTTHRR